MSRRIRRKPKLDKAPIFLKGYRREIFTLDQAAELYIKLKRFLAYFPGISELHWSSPQFKGDATFDQFLTHYSIYIPDERGE